MRWNVFRKSNIALLFENTLLTVYNFKCLEKGECYEWMLKYFGIMLRKMMIFYKILGFIEFYQNEI